MDTNAKKAVSFLSDGVFVAVGQKPHNEPFEKVVELKNGFIVTDEEMRTKTPGLFACGDCRTKKLRQVVTATNDGAIAANSANCYLQAL